MGIVSTFALSYLVSKMPRDGFLDRIVAADVPGILLAVPLFIGATMAWGAIGLATGLIYEAGDLASQPDFLGSDSAPFTIAMLAVAWIPAPPLIAFFRSNWWLWVVMSSTFAILFGWVLPFLAGR